jgi:hypothetical protein
LVLPEAELLLNISAGIASLQTVHISMCWNQRVANYLQNAAYTYHLAFKTMQAEHRSYYCIKTMRTSSRSLEADEEQCTCIVRVATEAGSVLEIEIELLEKVAECVALLFTCRC